MIRTEIRFEATQSSGDVSAVLLVPSSPSALYVFAHGAGAPMTHAFMERAAAELGQRGVATFRFNFPYMDGEKRRGPNPAPILEKTVRSAVAAARGALQDVPTFAGGKSMGGRMTSRAQAATPIEGLEGIIFYGFPLHAPGREPKDRADHLAEVDVPMLFLQGTRDRLARLDWLEPVVEGIDTATLHIVDGGDHSFKVTKKSGRTEDEVHSELADRASSWMAGIGSSR